MQMFRDEIEIRIVMVGPRLDVKQHKWLKD